MLFWVFMGDVFQELDTLSFGLYIMAINHLVLQVNTWVFDLGISLFLCWLSHSLFLFRFILVLRQLHFQLICCVHYLWLFLSKKGEIGYFFQEKINSFSLCFKQGEINYSLFLMCVLQVNEIWSWNVEIGCFVQKYAKRKDC